jgi:hypothetical protein
LVTTGRAMRVRHFQRWRFVDRFRALPHAFPFPLGLICIWRDCLWFMHSTVGANDHSPLLP